MSNDLTDNCSLSANRAAFAGFQSMRPSLSISLSPDLALRDHCTGTKEAPEPRFNLDAALSQFVAFNVSVISSAELAYMEMTILSRVY